ncbi:MAG TPA: hypothetical protein VMS74_14910 [Acidimicrobiia bacterium]|nr:hypothetical protein [Acidimicrobiia bacterium]
MPTSNPLEPRHRSIAEEDGESFESIPWEALDGLGRPGDSRRWYAVAGAIVVLVLGVSAARNLGSAEPVELVGAEGTNPTESVAEAILPPTTAASTVPAIVTEADLKALDPHVLERAAAAMAETAVRQFFSMDPDGLWAGLTFEPTRATFVEGVTAVTVTPLDQARFEVVVAVAVLDAAEGEAFVRRPARAVALVVDGSSGTFQPVDLPSPVPFPFDPFVAPMVRETEPVADVMAAIAESVSGVVEPTAVSYGTLSSGVTRVVATVVDEAGIGWPMVFHVGADGTLLPAG